MSASVDVDHPRTISAEIAPRSEIEPQRLERNWASLLQELRVVQTGVQLLTGLPLTLPFRQGFDILDNDMRIVCLAIVASSVASTVLLVAPVGMHRLLFAATAAKPWWPPRMAESAQSRCVGDNTR